MTTGQGWATFSVRSVPPVVVVSPREIEARIGDEVRFDCAAVVDSRDPSPRIVWSRQGGRDLDADAKDSGQGNLHIASFKAHHAGVYECTAIGVHSKATGLATLKLKGKCQRSLSDPDDPGSLSADSGHPPPVPEVTPKIQTVFENDQVVFNCKAEGNPAPVLTWGFGSANGQLLPNVRQDESRLIIDGAQIGTNEGQYFCTATNEHGSNSASGTLFVEEGELMPLLVFLMPI